ncbi:hypothetical protein VINI7043_21896 [Vibrio nigripulchritudo ATCC 27043]|nr:hypothetical protein VINI7043_21896 [Vibrio nigripulchritudo ATCC 27043]
MSNITATFFLIWLTSSFTVVNKTTHFQGTVFAKKHHFRLSLLYRSLSSFLNEFLLQCAMLPLSESTKFPANGNKIQHTQQQEAFNQQ